ncbi:hypothetical protein JCM10213_003556 [Rhodosporidiobolus nylandii]
MLPALLSNLPPQHTALPWLFALLHFFSTLSLSLAAKTRTPLLLCFPLLQYGLQFGGGRIQARVREGKGEKGETATGEAAEGTSGAKKWTIAALEVAGGVCRVMGSRMNAPWIWATVELYNPFLSLLFRASSPAVFETRHASLRLYATAGISTAVGLALWRTEEVSWEGVLLSLAAAACESGRQGMTESALEEEREVRKEAAAGLLSETGWRSIILHLATYLLFFPLSLHDPHPVRDQPLCVAAAVAWPIVSAVATVTLQAALALRAFDFFSSSFAYNFSSALRLGTLLVWGSTDFGIVRRTMLVICIAHALLYAAVARFPPSHFDLPKQASSAAYAPLAPSPSPRAFFSRHSLRLVALVPLLVPVVWVLHLVNSLHTVDVVVAHYSMPLRDLASHIALIRQAPLVRSSRTRVVLYEKGAFTDDELWAGLAGVARPGWDEIIHLPNFGREGGTYLEHITQRYNDTLPASGTHGRFSAQAVKAHGQRFWRKRRPVADHTLFLQSHLAWNWIAEPRLAHTLLPETGFVSFGPYLTNLCGGDGEGTGHYPGLQEVFAGVMDRQCVEGKEEDRVLSTWAGQFAVSRERVMANSLAFYEGLRKKIEAPNDDPIHTMWNPSGDSTQDNPAFGHSIERSWPLIFRCTDTMIAAECRDAEWEPSKCQCFDL